MSELKQCEECKNPISSGSERIIEVKKEEVTVCSNCLNAMERAVEDEVSDVNIFGAVVFGLIASALAAILWYGAVVITKYELGILAILVGVMVTYGVMLGAGKKRGPAVQLISVVLILATMAFSEYLIVRHFYLKTLSPEMAKEIPLFLPFNTMVNLLVEVIKEDPKLLIFWLVALITGLTMPAKRKIKEKSNSTHHVSV